MKLSHEICAHLHVLPYLNLNAGLSLLENGPLPSFISEVDMDAMLAQKNCSPAQQQFAEGLDLLRVLEVFFY